MIAADYFRRKYLEPLKEKQRLEKEARREELERVRSEALERARDEGRKQGREQADAEWDAWNRRRLAALAYGAPFAEPPPSSRRAKSESNGPTPA